MSFIRAFHFAFWVAVVDNVLIYAVRSTFGFPNAPVVQIFLVGGIALVSLSAGLGLMEQAERLVLYVFSRWGDRA